jgi:hypothetical protein
MNQIKVFAALTFTCVLAAVANALVSREFGYDLYALKLGLFAPVGAVILGFLAASGALVAARLFKATPQWGDAIALIALAAATVALANLVENSTPALEESYEATGLVDFRSYVGLLLAKLQTGAEGVRQIDEGEIYLSALEFLGFLAGGALCMSFASSPARKKCAICDSAVQRVKTAKSPILSFQETTGLLELFETGDSKTMQKLLAWTPEAKDFGPKSERATVTYDLYVCPKCKSEEVDVSVQAFKGKAWKDVPALSARRIFAEDLSLRDAFR